MGPEPNLDSAINQHITTTIKLVLTDMLTNNNLKAYRI